MLISRNNRFNQRLGRNGGHDPQRTSWSNSVDGQQDQKEFFFHFRAEAIEIEGIFASLGRDDPDFRGEVVVQIDRDPFKAEGHEALYEALARSAERALGRAPTAAGVNGWGDSGLTQGAGIPTLSFGALGGNFHAPDEWVSIEELVKGVGIVEDTIVEFCGEA